MVGILYKVHEYARNALGGWGGGDAQLAKCLKTCVWILRSYTRMQQHRPVISIPLMIGWNMETEESLEARGQLASYIRQRPYLKQGGPTPRIVF